MVSASASDRTALAYLAECSARIDASAKLADAILARLEDGSWTRVRQDEASDLQQAVMYSFFAVGNLLDPTKTDIPRATSADIRRVVDGDALGRTVGLLMGYSGEAESATGVMMSPYGPTAADKKAAPRHLRRLRTRRSGYLAQRAELAHELAALQRTYGSGADD